jgi:hypothetical protein
MNTLMGLRLLPVTLLALVLGSPICSAGGRQSVPDRGRNGEPLPPRAKDGEDGTPTSPSGKDGEPGAHARGDEKGQDGGHGGNSLPGSGSEGGDGGDGGNSTSGPGGDGGNGGDG